MDQAVFSPPSDSAALARRITLVIPAFNEASGIESCIRSLAKGAEDIEIMVLDGESSDATATIVEGLTQDFPRLSLHSNPRRNQAAALNKAAGLTDHSRDILIRCDAHAVYPEGFALSLAEKLVETGADSVVVPMDAEHREDAGPFEKALALIVDTPLGSGGSAHRGGSYSGWVDHGHHAAIWRDRFTALGGYNEEMVPNEDAEFDTRLRADGGKIWLDAGIRLRYFVRRNAETLWKQYWRYGRARARHMRAHKARPRLRQVIPWLHVLALMASVVVLPFSALGILYPALYGGALIAAAIQFIGKVDSGTVARIPAVLFTLHTAWGTGFLYEVLGGRR